MVGAILVSAANTLSMFFSATLAGCPTHHQHVDIPQTGAFQSPQPGDVAIICFSFLGEGLAGMVAGLYHMCAAVYCPINGWVALAFGEDGVTRHSHRAWKGIRATFAMKVGTAQRSYQAGQEIPVIPNPAGVLASDFMTGYHIINFNCCIYAWSVVVFVTRGEFAYVPSLMANLLSIQRRYNRCPFTRALIDTYFDNNGVHFGQEEEETLREDIQQAEPNLEDEVPSINNDQFQGAQQWIDMDNFEDSDVPGVTWAKMVVKIDEAVQAKPDSQITKDIEGIVTAITASEHSSSSQHGIKRKCSDM